MYVQAQRVKVVTVGRPGGSNLPLAFLTPATFINLPLVDNDIVFLSLIAPGEDWAQMPQELVHNSLVKGSLS